MAKCLEQVWRIVHPSSVAHPGLGALLQFGAHQMTVVMVAEHLTGQLVAQNVAKSAEFSDNSLKFRNVDGILDKVILQKGIKKYF